MGIYHQMKWVLKISPTILKLVLKKLKYKDRFSFKILQNISFGTKIKLDDTGQINIGTKVQIRELTELHASSNGKINIGDGVFINRGGMVVCKDGISIGSSTAIGPNVLIYDHDHDIEHFVEGGYKTAKIFIGKNCWIGAGSIILKGVSIGDNTVVAAGSIVTKDISENSIYKNIRNIDIRRWGENI